MADLVLAQFGDLTKPVGRAFAESAELEILDEPTHSPSGRIRGIERADGRTRKPKTSVAKKAAEKKAASAAASDTPLQGDPA